MSKTLGTQLQSKFTLSSKPLTVDEASKCFTDFSYFTSHAVQIINKNRQSVYMGLNAMQMQFFDELLPLIDEKTRPNTHIDVVWIKPRQGGGTVGLTEALNYMCSYVKDLTNMSILHILQSGRTARKLYEKKVRPIISGTHPTLMPSVYESGLSPQGAMLYYDNFRGRTRNNTIEYLSSGSSAIRSDTVHVAIYDEFDSYRKPEQLEDAVQGAMPKNSWSLSVYISTISERGQLIEKAKIARANPDVMKFIFTPWFFLDEYEDEDTSYYNLKDLHLTRQEAFICQEMKRFKIPAKRWLKKLSFYRKELLRFNNSLERMRREYPTSESEVFQTAKDNLVFSRKKIKAMQDELSTELTTATIYTDQMTGEHRYSFTKLDSPFHIRKPPEVNKRYLVSIDPIDSISEISDNLTLLVTDLDNLEDVAWFSARNLSDDDMADWIVKICSIYNNPQIIIENNVGKSLVRSIRQKGYRRFWYKDKAAMAKDDFGVKTTRASKKPMVEDLAYLIDNDLYKISDPEAIYEFLHFTKEMSKTSDYVKMEASGKDRDGRPYKDDRVMCRVVMSQALPEYWFENRMRDEEQESFNIFG